jgi:hypothetical protein
MNLRLLELREQRGLLRARCAAQRQALAEHSLVLEQACAAVDRVRAGAGWIKRHPGAVGVIAAFLVALKPRRVWRWGRRALFFWQGWRALKRRLFI